MACLLSNARTEPGLVVDEQEYGALRRQALVGAAPGALGLVSRFTVAHAHNVLLLQKRVSCRAQPSAAEYLEVRSTSGHPTPAGPPRSCTSRRLRSRRHECESRRWGLGAG